MAEEDRPIPGSSTTIPLMQETASVATTAVETGRVEVNVATGTTTVRVPLDVIERRVAVERVAIGRYVDTAPATRVEGDVTIVSIIEEHPVVQLRLFLREEVHIRSETRRHHTEQDVVLRHETATIHRSGGETSDGAALPPRHSQGEE